MGPHTTFHIAIPVDDLQAARQFYGTVRGCAEARSSAKWIDFNMFGHQIVAHHVETLGSSCNRRGANSVDGHDVPVPHFRVVLQPTEWQTLATNVGRGVLVVSDVPGAARLQQPFGEAGL